MKSFADLGVNKDILKGVSSLGFEEPTPVQQQVIPLVLQEKADMVSLAQTGTGKTAAFGLPLIQLTDINNRQPQSLILCPTRELCVQVSRDLQTFASHINKLSILAIYGGASIENQIKALRRGVQIIVATPGRLNDLIRRNQVNISKINHVVFDEADEMLQMGFKDEIDAILAKTPADKNTLLFSATMSREVKRIASKYMANPIELAVGKLNAGAENINHEYYLVNPKDRYPALKRIVDHNPDIYSIIFCRTRLETNDVANKLMADGYNADSLHGDLSQAQRDQVMQKFRNRNIQILVATDVAARGLDVNDLTHVINYNLPDENAAYTHRSGRTGRAGRSGISIAIITGRERFRLKAIENKINKKFKQCQIPSGKDICQKQLLNLADIVLGMEVDHGQIDPLFNDIAEKLKDLDRDEIIKKFISFESNRFFKYYKNAPDLNVKKKGKKEKRGKEDKWSPTGKKSKGPEFTRFYLNAGKRQGILPESLMARINQVPGTSRIKIGKIEIKRNATMLEGDSRFIDEILGAFGHAEINGKTITIEVAKSKPAPRKRPRPGHKKTRPRKKRKFKTS